MSETRNTQEVVIENNLISQLETLGWEYCPELNSTDKLWDNLRKIVESNNSYLLNNQPLSENEFNQLKTALSFTSIESFEKFLIGENGICKVTIIMDNNEKEQLIVFNTKYSENTKFQVTNQIVVKKLNNRDRDSRFDVTLLIDGFPIAQIELKKHSVGYIEAFNQISNYAKESKYTGIFSSLRLFIVSNKSGTRYFSNQTSTKFDTTQLVCWQEQNGTNVEDLHDFANQFLKPEFLMKIATKYFLFDNRKKKSIVLRPYQIHAVEQIEEAINLGKSGYIWHTTGSGKTLTSFCATKYLTTMTNRDKTIFLVDRIDLDQQTNAEFLAYSDYSASDINTEHIGDLRDKLLISGNSLIITTVQKLNKLIDKIDNKELHDLKLTFVVDECHRAISLEQMEKIDSYFDNCLWYGFTGTPIFKDSELGIDGTTSAKGFEYTTEHQYKNVLHEYTIKEAIKDGSVLMFKTDFLDTLTLDTKQELYKHRYKKNEVDTSWGLADYEKMIINNEKLFKDNSNINLYGKEHKLKVLDTIVNKSVNLFDFNRPVGDMFCALFTTKSINEAMEYYNLLSDFKNGSVENHPECIVDSRILEKTPDFPKFAITFSLNDNQENSYARSEFMKNVLDNYNNEFGTKWTIDNIQGYNQDVSRRLARKERKYSERSEQLDLVIVVNRLLTGFDAPMLSTLFIDREPLALANLIQAMSRTNRKYSGKYVGNIVGFRKPYLSKDNLDLALTIYSNGGYSDVIAPDWELIREQFIEKVREFNEKYPSKSIVDNLSSLPDKKEFVKDFQELDNQYKRARAYFDYDVANEKTEYGFDKSRMVDLHGSYVNIREFLRESKESSLILDDIDLNYQVEALITANVDYNYIINLIELFIQTVNSNNRNLKKLLLLINQIKEPYKSNEDLLNIFDKLIEDIQKNASKYININIHDEIYRRVMVEINLRSKKFASKYCLNPNIVRNIATLLKTGEELKDSVGNQTFINELKSAKENYNIENPNNKLSGFIFNKRVKKEFKLFVENDIQPFYEFYKNK